MNRTLHAARRRHSSGLFAVALAVAPAFAQSREAVDDAAIKILRTHGLEQSQVMEHLSWMCDVYGPRLTGSPNIQRAQAWAVKTFGEFGLQNAKTETWGPFGRSWRCDHASMEVIGDNPWPVLAYPKAWSPSLPGRIEAEVVLATAYDAEQLKAMNLTGKIVLMDDPRDVREPFDGISKRHDSEDLLALADQRRPEDRSRERRAAAASATADFRAGFQRRGEMQRIVGSKNPLCMIDRGGKGDYGTVFVQGASAQPKPGSENEAPVGSPAISVAGGAAAGAAGGAGNPPAGGPGGGGPGRGGPRGPSARDKDAVVIPQFTIAVEHYNRMCRILKKGLPLRVAIELQTTFFDDDSTCANVTAEIPGADQALKDQVVMLGAHFDSWHTGTGATDNGCGSAVVMEASRLLQQLVKETGKGPRRTIRAALWTGEEQGLLGSRAYCRQHFKDDKETKPEHARLAGYFNLDNGTGKVRGVYLQGNEATAPIFRAWLKPFHDLGASTLSMDDTGGTDHLSFDGVGLPGFQFIQDPVSYDSRTHHSNMDVWDHAVADDLKQASTIMAAFVWHAAQRDEMLPRPPARPAGEGGGRRRGPAGQQDGQPNVPPGGQPGGPPARQPGGQGSGQGSGQSGQ